VIIYHVWYYNAQDKLAAFGPLRPPVARFTKGDPRNEASEPRPLGRELPSVKFFCLIGFAESSQRLVHLWRKIGQIL